MASYAIAETDNSEGMAGVCWNCRVMPVVRASSSHSSMTDANVWAVDHGARVINGSYGTSEGSETLSNGVGYAADAGVVHVAINHNDGAPSIRFPARYLETIAVGATAFSDGRAFFSNWGPETDVVAPGQDVLGADLGGGYSPGSGTSYAAPHVAGLVGLVLSLNPSAGREEVRHLIRSGADDEVGYEFEDTPGFDEYHGWGRINMERALLGTEASIRMRIEGKTATRAYFEGANPLADSYDFVRGDLGALSEDRMGVDLGGVVCLENDSPDPDTVGNEDLATPAPGHGFFYLARFNAAPGAGSYGGSSRNRDRMIFAERMAANWTSSIDQEGAQLGFSAASAGDVNGDGYDDVLVGAPLHDYDQTDDGAVFVYLGSAGGVASTPHRILDSDQSFSWYGYSAAGAGDVNGDGYDDVVVGAFRYDNGHNNEGKAFIYFGSSSGLDPTSHPIGEGDQSGAWYGLRVSSAGDVNGDGYDDVVVGARLYDNGELNEGAAFVYLGSSSGLQTPPHRILESDQAEANFSTGLGPAGDVDGDGYDDVVIGAPEFDNGETDEGAVFVYHGSPSGLEATPRLTLEIDVVDARYGHRTRTAGDINGDGYDDLIVGAPYYDNGEEREGAAFVYLGSEDGLITKHAWSFESDQRDAECGVMVNTAGDVNGDRYDDVIVGAGYFDGIRSDQGRVWVFLGSESGLASEPHWSMVGERTGGIFGRWAASAGNVNGDVDGQGDPIDDVIVSAIYHDHAGFDEGRAYVYHGPLTPETPPVDCPR